MKNRNRARAADPAERPKKDRDRCRECPLFYPANDWRGNDVHAPVFETNPTTGKNERVLKDDIPQFWRHLDGSLVRWGLCGAKLPQDFVLRGVDGFDRVGPTMLETRSDWFCESDEKYAGIARLKAKGAIK
jgi:hypothetical protein